MAMLFNFDEYKRGRPQFMLEVGPGRGGNSTYRGGPPIMKRGRATQNQINRSDNVRDLQAARTRRKMGAYRETHPEAGKRTYDDAVAQQRGYGKAEKLRQLIHKDPKKFGEAMSNLKPHERVKVNEALASSPLPPLSPAPVHPMRGMTRAFADNKTLARRDMSHADLGVTKPLSKSSVNRYKRAERDGLNAMYEFEMLMNRLGQSWPPFGVR